jgi:tetratricopeptide (TPR) repeat protein
MRRLILLFVVALAVSFAAVPASAQFGRKPAASPSPAAEPTATPEPLDVQIPRLEAKVKADPNDRDDMQQLASDYLEIQRPDLSLPLTQHLLSTGTKTAAVYYFDGFAQSLLGKAAEAVYDLEQASNLDPTNKGVLGMLTDLYIRTGRGADAERVAKRATTFNGNDAQVWLQYGMVLERESKFDEARAAFEQSAKLAPADATPITMEARTYVEQSAPVLALQVYDRALSIEPNFNGALSGKAQVYAQQHDVKNSIATWEKLLGTLTDSNDKITVLLAEANVYAAEKQNDQADAAFKRATAQFPDSPQPHLAYGDWLGYQKKDQQAVVEWTAALGAKQDNPAALSRLGTYYAANNQLPKAIEDFKKVTDGNPNAPDGFMQLGQAYLAARTFDKGRDAFRHAYDMTHAPQSLAGIGEADYELRDYKEASQIWDALDKGARDFLESNPELYVLAGKCYSANNENGKAKSAYMHFLSFVKPDSQAATSVKKLIADLDHPGAKPAPKPTTGSSSH